MDWLKLPQTATRRGSKMFKTFLEQIKVVAFHIKYGRITHKVGVHYLDILSLHLQLIGYET